ncbi:MAG: heme o synthase [Hyphomicrobiales bacterium]|nr:heme o synthase [Hyphomicrobiales bacterium]
MEREGLADNEWRTGWRVVAASMAGFMLASFYSYTFGAFIGPIEQEFGWSRAQISIGLSVITLSAAILTPILGWVIDRIGPRRVAIPGAIGFALTYGLLGLTTDNIWTWWGIWLLLSFSIVGIKPLVWSTAVASTFERNRGLALAIAMCGSGLASAFGPSLSTWAIDQFGWRGAYLFLALAIGGLVTPVVWFWLHSGADLAKRATPADGAPQAVRSLYGLGAKEAMLSWKFVRLALAAFVFTIAAIGISLNIMPILVSFEFGRTEAAAIAGVAGISSIVGRLATGSLLDRFNPNIVAGIVVLVPVASCLLLISAPGNTTIAILAVAVIGASGAAGAFNHYYERDLDRLMKRTRNRPFASGAFRASPWWPIGFLVLLSASLALATAVGGSLAAFFVFLGAFTYGIVYTVWLKRRTVWNIVVGGLAGSFAVLAGAAAVDPTPQATPYILAVVLFLWTPPHFWSLAAAKGDDYAAAGVPMLPIVVPERAWKAAVLAHAVALVAISLVPLAFGKGLFYGLGAGLGGAYFVYKSWLLYWKPTKKTAMANFFASLIQLVALVIGVTLDAAFGSLI